MTRVTTLVILLCTVGCGAVDATPPDDDTGDEPPDAALPACTAASDCTDPLLPFCLDGACVACDGDAACDAGAPVCDEVDHTCGGCATSDDCSAYAATPVCGGDGACRRCELDDECATGACNFATGACYAASEIVFVAPGGSASATCGTSVDPCGSLAAAAGRVTAARPVVRMRPGTYGGQPVPASPVPLVVHAAGARIRVTTTSDNVGVFSSAGTDLTILDGTIEVVAVAGAVFRAVDVAVGARVVLYRTALDLSGAIATGVESEGTFVADRISIEATGPAIGAYAGSVQLSRSRVTGGTGLYIGTPTFTITNNVLAYAKRAAVVIDSPLGTPKRLDHNTFLANGQQVTAGAMELDVVRVVMPEFQRFAPSHNIFTNARPYTGAGGLVLSTFPLFTSLLDQPNLPPSADGNLYAAAAITADGRLTASSPAIDAIANDTLADDIDGDPRPLGGGYDMGADEYVP